MRPRTPDLSAELEALYQDSSTQIINFLTENGEESISIFLHYDHIIQDWHIVVAVENSGAFRGLLDPNGRLSVDVMPGSVNFGRQIGGNPEQNRSC